MTDREIRHTHDCLMKVNESIWAQFPRLGEKFMKSLYSEPNSPELYRQVLEYGDGYTLRSVPSCVGEFIDSISEAELVLIVAKFPLLAKNSVFDPYMNLVDIPYWRRKGLQREDELANGRLRKFQFWIWQNDSPVHGSGSFDNAQAKEKRLLRRSRALRERRSRALRELIQDQKDASGRLVTACKEWLAAQGREMTVFVHNNLETEVDHAIKQFRQDESVFYKTTNVFKDGNIMDLLTKQKTR